ncbi:MAG: DNA gyrase inhibitor YacG [Deltaproteobacteria bacterium]
MIRPIECPICHKPVPVPAGQIPNWFPFCSERCRQVDLLRWSKGKYAIVEPLKPEHLDEDENQV